MENNILSLISKEEKDLLSVKCLRRRQTLFSQFDLCEHVTFVVSGELKIATYLFSGEELVFNVVRKNQMLGNNLIFSDRPIYKGDVVAMQDTTVVLIPKENLIRLLQTNREFLTAYLREENNFTKRLNSTIKMLAYDSAEKRLIYYLLTNNNKIEFKSVQDLADIIHLQRETLSRLITKLEKEHVIQRAPHELYLLKVNHESDW